MDILTILIGIVVVILLPLGQVFRIDLGNSIAINPLDIGVLLVVIVSAITAIMKKQFPKILLPLGIFGALGLLGLLIQVKLLSAQEFTVSLLYLFRFFAYTSIALGVWLLKKEQRAMILKMLLIGGGIVVVAGYIQYFFYQSLWGVLYEGWDPHLYRMFSTFLDPNFSGPFFVLYFLLILHMWFEEKQRKNKIAFAVLGILSFFAIILSFSRGAYVDGAISILVYLSLRGHKKIALGTPVLVLVLSLCIAFFLPYGEEKHLLRTASTQARLISAENALTIFVKNPIVGVGFNSYRYAQHRYHLLSGFNWEDTHSGAGVNNSYVFVLATTGILGGIAYGWFWLGILKGSFRSLQQKKWYALFFFASWIALLVSGIFENTLFYPSIMVWMFVLVGLTSS